jgi:hypothetical protein
MVGTILTPGLVGIHAPGYRAGMSRIVVHAFIALDGVVQGGGGPGEDDEGDFRHGGWAMDYDRAHDVPRFAHADRTGVEELAPAR